MLLALTACAGNKKNEIKLGSSDFSLVIPEGYKETKDDFDEGQVAYYYKDDDSIDFDVYQWAKEGNDTLQSKADGFANEYGAELKTVVINGINCITFVTEEEYKGQAYTIVNYMFEGESGFAGVCFWTTNTEAEHAAVDAIINTLSKN